MLSVHSDPACKFPELVWSNNLTMIWKKPLTGTNLGATAFAILNLGASGGSSTNVSVTWDQLGMDTNREVLVSDVWLYTNYSGFNGFTATVESDNANFFIARYKHAPSNYSNDEETRSWQNITYYGTGQSKNTMETYGPAPFYNNDGMTQSAANQIARWSWPAPVNAVSCVVRYQVFSAYVGTVAWTNYPQVAYNAPSGRVVKDAANDSRLTNSVIACPSGTFTWHTNYIYWNKTNTSIFPGVVWNASTNASARYVVGPVFIKWGY